MIDDRGADLERIPANRLFGWTYGDRSSDGAEMILPLRPEFVQREGIVHGGVVTALADTAAVYALVADLPDHHALTSVELKINFLRPVRPDGGDMVARSTVVKRGRRVAVCRVDILQGDQLAATGMFTYLIYERESS